MVSCMTNHGVFYVAETSPEDGGRDTPHALKSVGGAPRWLRKESTWFVNPGEFSVEG